MKQFTLRKQIAIGRAALLVAIVAGWAAVGCEKQDLNRTFEGPYFVRFTDSTITVKESRSLPLAIRVHNAGPLLSQAITINYTVSGSAREGKDYSISDTKGTVVIPANKSFGEINVKLINNANNILESKFLTFTLTGVQPSTLQVGFGKEGITGKQLTLTIEDDCLFGGLYTGLLRFDSQSVTVPDIAITSTDCKNYLLSNWNIGLLDFQAIKPTLQFIDNGDNSLTIPAQTNENLGSSDTLRGTGAWNPRNRVVTLNIDLKTKNRANRDTVFRFVQTFTPQ